MTMTSDHYENDYQPGGKPFTGRRLLFIILAFFAVIITANMTMLYFAVTNFTGLVVKNSYHAGLSFEADRAKNRAAAISKWGVTPDLKGDAIRLTLVDAAGQPVTGRKLTAVIGRPSHNRVDRKIAFRETAPGVYTAERPAGDGAWRLVLVDRTEAAPALRNFEFYRAPGPDGATKVLK